MHFHSINYHLFLIYFIWFLKTHLIHWWEQFSLALILFSFIILDSCISAAAVAVVDSTFLSTYHFTFYFLNSQMIQNLFKHLDEDEDKNELNLIRTIGQFCNKLWSSIHPQSLETVQSSYLLLILVYCSFLAIFEWILWMFSFCFQFKWFDWESWFFCWYAFFGECCFFRSYLLNRMCFVFYKVE